MEKTKQLDLYQRLKAIIKKKEPSGYKISKQGEKTVFMIIESSNMEVLRRLKIFIESLGVVLYDKDRANKNHGKMDGTHMISLSDIDPKVAERIDLEFSLIKKKKNFIEEVLNKEAGQEKPECQVSRKKCQKFELKKYLVSLLRFEGINVDSFKISKEKEQDRFIFCSEDEEIISIAINAINFFFGENVCSVKNGCIDVPSGTECSTSKKYLFCCSPKEGDKKEDVLRRLNRVFFTKKYFVEKIDKGFSVSLSSKKVSELEKALKQMGWNVDSTKVGFNILISKKPLSLNKNQKEQQNQKKEFKMSKEDILNKISSFIDSEDFLILEKDLQDELVKKREDLKFILKRKEEITNYAKELLLLT